MPNVTTQTSLVSPTNGTQSYAVQDLEMGKFVLNNGTVSTRVTLTSGAVNIGTVSVPDATADKTAFSVGTSQGNLMMGAYEGTATTIGIGTTGVMEIDANRNLMINPATLLAGEDLTNNVMKVEQRFSYAYSAAVGTTVIKASAGFLHGITLGSTSAGGALTIYDNASGTSATVIGLLKASAAEGFYAFDVSFANGCVVANVGTQTYTVSYR